MSRSEGTVISVKAFVVSLNADVGLQNEASIDLAEVELDLGNNEINTFVRSRLEQLGVSVRECSDKSML